MKTLDIEAVKAFVLAAELKSFTRAAEALDTTQSAISLKIKRLEKMLGRHLLERTPRLVGLSADGQQFMVAARKLVAAHQGALAAFSVSKRRLVIGISHHIVGAELPLLLKQMHDAEQDLVLEVRIASSHEVLACFDRGTLDAAIVLGHDHLRKGGDLILEERFGWMAAPGFAYHPGEPLRLAAQSESCRVRSIALAALKEHGIAWSEVFVGGGITTIGAAVAAGFAIAALGCRVAPAGTMDAGPKFGLPALPTLDVLLYSSASDPKTRNSLRRLAAAIRSTAA